MIVRGGIYWADLGPPAGSRPAKRRPVAVVQAAPYNVSRLATAVVAVLTSNTGLASMPGNVFLPAEATGLRRDSVVNVTSLATVDKADLEGPVGVLAQHLVEQVDAGLRRVLAL